MRVFSELIPLEVIVACPYSRSVIDWYISNSTSSQELFRCIKSKPGRSRGEKQDECSQVKGI